MSGQESEENKCRICLDENVDLHWNDVLYDNSTMTYKDCYYKYTHLEYFDDDFSSMLCRNCSNGLEYIDAFISKAIETHIILQEKFSMVVNDGADDIKNDTNFETILVDETEIKPDIQKHHKFEDSDEEFLSKHVENKNSNRYERSTTPLSQSRKPLKTARKKITEEVTNDESLSDEKKNSKRLEQPICCSICSKVLASRYKAVLHEKTHTKERERNETCVECGLKFYNKGSLRCHMLTHLENREKAHKCEFCDKAFYNKSALNIHQRIHFGQMIPCSLCPKEFFRQIDLDKHMTSHSAVRISSDVKMRSKCFVRCKDCGKNIRSTSFKSHNAKHMNEPLFKCTICEKEFFFRCSCVKHLKTYHKKKNADVINFIIAYKTNRISHLFLQQNTDIQVKEE